MKVLLIGMDGAHTEVFERGWTPFISSLLKSKGELFIKNDLLSRGWLEIATGQHAKKTGAMYDMPAADGTLLWKSDFCIHDIPGIGQTVKPLWQKLNEKGCSVGIMNLPTTFPAPEVDGFFVSGGGGGAPVTENITSELCYPKEITSLLNKNGYIVDDRLYQLVVDKNLTSSDEILKRLSYKNQKRTESFIELGEKYSVEFGFVVYKTSSVLAETLIQSERSRRENTDNRKDKELIYAIKNYYQNFDNEIKKLHNAFPSAEMIFVSDHGTAVRRYSVNLNIFLQQAGLQRVRSKQAIIKVLIEKLKGIIPFSIKAYLKKTMVMKAKNVGQTNFNSPQTSAFCKTQGDWSHGIYINDGTRFGGPVEDQDISVVKAEIINSFNSHAEAMKHNLYAYSEGGNSSDNPDHFPDIVIDLPDGYLTTDKGSEFITKFTPPKSSSALASIMKGEILSIKSHSPLAVSSCSESGSAGLGGQAADLTAVYELVVGKF